MARRPLALGAVIAALAACMAPAPATERVDVTLYGRNAGPLMAWFATQPSTDPLSSIGFGPELGYACWTVPAGSSLVMLDHAPSEDRPASVLRVLEAIERGPSGRRSLWVDVDPTGAVTNGSGIPAWWPPGGGSC